MHNVRTKPVEAKAWQNAMSPQVLLENLMNTLVQAHGAAPPANRHSIGRIF